MTDDGNPKLLVRAVYGCPPNAGIRVTPAEMLARIVELERRVAELESQRAAAEGRIAVLERAKARSEEVWDRLDALAEHVLRVHAAKDGGP